MLLLKNRSVLVLLCTLLLVSCVSHEHRELTSVTYKEVTELSVGSPAAVAQYGEDPLQFAELWLPENLEVFSASGALPTVIFIHGGCWLNAYDIAHSRAMTAALAEAGFAVWSLEYRRTGDKGGGWPGTFEDILSALRYLKTRSDPQVDFQRLSVVGHSAGGHLALLAGSEEASLGIRFEQVIGLAAIFDLEQYARGDNSCQGATSSFMGGGPEEVTSAFLEADPKHRKLHTNTVLLHGDKDNIVPLSQSTQSGERFRIISGAGHFDFLHPRSKAWRVLLETLKE